MNGSELLGFETWNWIKETLTQWLAAGASHGTVQLERWMQMDAERMREVSF